MIINLKEIVEFGGAWQGATLLGNLQQPSTPFRDSSSRNKHGNTETTRIYESNATCVLQSQPYIVHYLRGCYAKDKRGKKM